MKPDQLSGSTAYDFGGHPVHPIVPTDMLPKGTRCVELHANAENLDRYHQLFSEEQDLVKSAVDRRKADFGDARWCAHAAMTFNNRSRCESSSFCCGVISRRSGILMP